MVKKMLKAFKLLPLEKQPWKFPTSSCLAMAFKLAMEISTVKMIPRNIFCTAFFTQHTILGKSSYHHHFSKS